jgi:hypothetical protein
MPIYWSRTSHGALPRSLKATTAAQRREMTNAQLQKLLNKNGITLRKTNRAPNRVAPKAKGLAAPKSRMTEQLERLLPVGEAAPVVNHSKRGVIKGLTNNNNNDNNNNNNNNNNNDDEEGMFPEYIPGLPPVRYFEPPEPSVAAEVVPPTGGPLEYPEGLNLFERPPYQLRYDSLPTNPYRRPSPTEDGMGMGGYRRTRRTKRKSSMKKRK